MIKYERLQHLFLSLVRINSPSKDERRMADFLPPHLEALGYEVFEDNAGARIGGTAGNVYAFKQGASRNGVSITFSAHLDTVQPTSGLEPVVTQDGVVKTDGSSILGADDKAGVAAIIEALRVVEEEDIPYRGIQVIFDVAEEIGLLGAKLVPKESIRGDFVYVLDTEKPVASIVVAGPSHENLKAVFTGRASHAGINPEAGVNAIVAASRAISMMKLGRIDFETTANVGVIEGGVARNIVAERAEVLAEARSRGEEKLAAQRQHMLECFREGAAEVGASVEIEVQREYNAFRWKPDDPIIRLASSAGESIGISPQLVEAGGGSDANIYNEIGVPTVLIGVGYEGAHSTSEQIAVADLAKCAEFLVALIRKSGETERDVA
ncbi:MAG: M20/M25/M40 family metallo-hydrolase [Armatimonadota bacterium]|nr:M20/M25/M40 family metallo-hydrolase [Armatimonadota bacterium]